MMLCIMTQIIAGLFAIVSKYHFTTMLCHYAQHYYAAWRPHVECHILSVDMLRFIMLRFIMLSVIYLNIVMLSIILLRSI
jgi:hypothetical protein